MTMASRRQQRSCTVFNTERAMILVQFLLTAFYILCIPSTDAIIPHLPFGDVNVVILTDVHSWVAGHRRQEPAYDADLGDVLSFWERLKDHCDANQIDLFLVNNGDFVHGTGLSQTNPGDPSYLIPLLEKMPYDAVNCGNHELYTEENVEFMMRPGGYVDWWGDRYLTANVMRKFPAKDPKQPLGYRYKILHGRQQNTKLLTFGFLYNMKDAYSGLIHVDDVQNVIQQQWFVDALLEERYDAILVLAHMDLVDPLVDVIRAAIRHNVGQGTPIVFVTGHTHYRGVKQLEDLTMTFEAGRYLDTVGFVSFPKKESVRSDNASSLFQHQFLDASRRVLFQDTLGMRSVTDGLTENGKALSEFIDETRQKLGLEKEIGCAPQSYFVERPVDSPDSLWGLYRDQVIPKMFQHHPDRTGKGEEDESAEVDGLPLAMILSKESWRYNIYSNATLVADDIMAVAPFNDTVVYLGTFPASVILKAHQTLNGHKDEWMAMLPNYILIGHVSNDTSSGDLRYHLYTHDFQDVKVQQVLQDLSPETTVTIQPTEFRSTMIWMAFVKEYWTCDGRVGQLPDWFPTPNHIFENSSSTDSQKRVVGIVMAIVLASFLVACGYCFWMMVRYFCTYQPVLREEDENIALYRDNDEDTDAEIHEVPSAADDVDSIGKCNTESTDLDEDHEMVMV